MPDSPTGRAVAAWLDLLDKPARIDAQGFAAQWLAPEAALGAAARLERLVQECGGGRQRGARRSGPVSATLMLALPGSGRECALSFELEAAPPHRIRSWSIEIGAGGSGGAAGPSLPPLTIPDGGDARAAVGAWLAELAKQGLFSGAVLVARGGSVAFEQAFGLADRASQSPATPDTRFDVGSITKAFTKVAIGQLVAAGKLKLTDTVQKALPDYPNPEVGRRITIQQLLDHRSGLGDIFNERFVRAAKERLVAPRDFFPLFADEPLAFEPGSSQAYSNAGYIVLGAIVEAASGQDYAGYVTEHVFKRAGMSDSGFLKKDGAMPRLAVGYTRLTPSGERGELVPNLGRLPVQGCSAGSSSHTARDLLRFDQALRSGVLLGERTAWYFAREGGAGAAADTAAAASAAYGIGGGGPGVNAVIDSDGRSVIVVLANLDPPAASQVAQQLRPVAARLEPPPARIARD